LGSSRRNRSGASHAANQDRLAVDDELEITLRGEMELTLRMPNVAPARSRSHHQWWPVGMCAHRYTLRDVAAVDGVNLRRRGATVRIRSVSSPSHPQGYLQFVINASLSCSRRGWAPGPVPA